MSNLSSVCDCRAEFWDVGVAAVAVQTSCSTGDGFMLLKAIGVTCLRLYNTLPKEVAEVIWVVFAKVAQGKRRDGKGRTNYTG